MPVTSLGLKPTSWPCGTAPSIPVFDRVRGRWGHCDETPPSRRGRNHRPRGDWRLPSDAMALSRSPARRTKRYPTTRVRGTHSLGLCQVAHRKPICYASISVRSADRPVA
jgi:hypothetical protein